MLPVQTKLYTVRWLAPMLLVHFIAQFRRLVREHERPNSMRSPSSPQHSSVNRMNRHRSPSVPCHTMPCSSCCSSGISSTSGIRSTGARGRVAGDQYSLGPAEACLGSAHVPRPPARLAGGLQRGVRAAPPTGVSQGPTPVSDF